MLNPAARHSLMKVRTRQKEATLAGAGQFAALVMLVEIGDIVRFPQRPASWPATV
jgi:hypothetical protein